MEFKQVKEWKEKELEGYKVALEEYKTKSEELREAHINIKEQLSKLLEIKRQNGINVDYIHGHFTDKEAEELYQQREHASYKYMDFTYNKNRFFSDNGWKVNFEEICKKQIDKHFNTLQAKVEKKIGKILEISHLGGDDYRFKGELDECKVEVILAGGYNIQRLHTRWIIKK